MALKISDVGVLIDVVKLLVALNIGALLHTRFALITLVTLVEQILDLVCETCLDLSWLQHVKVV